MGCFSFSHSERGTTKSRHKRFYWGFFSLGSAPQSKKPPSHTKSQTMSEPCLDELPSRNLSQSSSQRPPDLRIFSYTELRVATNNFSRTNLLGEGGFGCVYKGVIKHQYSDEGVKDVAVKQLNRKGQQGHKEWLAEVRFLGLVEHPNLVKLVGYCAEDDERGIQRLLVYEYMANGSLEDHLFQKRPSVLSWQERLRILLGAARGLAYLHEDMNEIQVIFRDFKTSNVLLDKDFTPKLSDFGLAREGPEVGATHVSTAVVGTMGYAAPEYIQTGHLTSKSDVWSFGVVLLEILSGRRSLDRNRPKNEQHLLDWVKPHVNGNGNLHNVMDPRLEGNYSLLQAQRISALAQHCLGKHAKSRPIMSTVVEKLTEIIELADISSQQSDVASTSLTSKPKEALNADEMKESASAKRRRLLLKEVMNVRSRDDGRFWRVFAPKLVKA